VETSIEGFEEASPPTAEGDLNRAMLSFDIDPFPFCASPAAQAAS
jgi:hypothetical protein